MFTGPQPHPSLGLPEWRVLTYPKRAGGYLGHPPHHQPSQVPAGAAGTLWEELELPLPGNKAQPSKGKEGFGAGPLFGLPLTGQPRWEESRSGDPEGGIPRDQRQGVGRGRVQSGIELGVRVGFGEGS